MLKPLKQINYLTILQTLHLQLSPNQVLVNSLNFVIYVNDFIFVGSLFHILGPRAVKLLSPQVAVFMMSDYDIIWSYFCVCFWSENILHI